MDLSERKLKILEAIISDYISEGEPIGSRTIAKNYSLGVSSATIRNEMSDLEDLGLIIQPHASSGRIPSDKGYRLYVDNLLNNRKLNNEHEKINVLTEVISSNINKIEILMEETARAISLLTNYVAVVSTPLSNFSNLKIKHMQLVPVDQSSLLLVIVFQNSEVRNIIINLDDTKYSYTLEYLNSTTTALNAVLSNKCLDEISEDNIKFLVELLNGDDSLINLIMKNLIDADSSNEGHIYAKGVNNILTYPEFSSNMDKAKEVFKAIEQKDFLKDIVSSHDEEKMEIVIGSENDIVQMKDFSIIKARYNVGDNKYGNIGIIGPKRMNYRETIAVLNKIVDNINLALKSLDDG